MVLGSTGFVGAALLGYLEQSCSVPVMGFSSATLNLAFPDSVGKLRSILDEGTILIVAARSRSNQDLFRLFSEETAIAKHVAQSLSGCKIRKCLYFSSLSVYGDTHSDLCITEDTKIAPTSLYGTAKFAGECVIRQTAETSGTPVAILRPCKIYGPGGPSHVYGPVGFIDSILRSGLIRLFGDGSELRDHLFVGDLVRVVGHLAFNDFCGVCNLATGTPSDFREMVALLRAIACEEFEVIQLDRTRPRVDQKIDPAKLLNALPGFRFVSLREGLEETYRFVSRNPHSTSPQIRA